MISIKKIALVGLVISTSLSLIACHTVQGTVSGVGRDISSITPGSSSASASNTKYHSQSKSNTASGQY